MKKFMVITYREDKGEKTVTYQGRVIYQGRDDFSADGALCSTFSIYMDDMDDTVLMFYGPKKLIEYMTKEKYTHLETPTDEGA